MSEWSLEQAARASSHLDIEQPIFAGKPHIWIQWKGTEVCADIHCKCGYFGHYDGDFLYYFQCPACQTVWEVGTHVPIYEVVDSRAEGRTIQQLKETDL